MVKIHGLVYIIIGMFISILSWRLNYEKLIFFFYVGLIFVFVGIVKLIFGLIRNRTNKKEISQKKIHPQSQNIKYCHQCGFALKQHHKFCTKCGARI